MEITIFLKYLKIYTNTDLKIIFLNHQNNHVEDSNAMSNTTKNFDILAIILSILHNYFASPTKLFSDIL